MSSQFSFKHSDEYLELVFPGVGCLFMGLLSFLIPTGLLLLYVSFLLLVDINHKFTTSTYITLGCFVILLPLYLFLLLLTRESGGKVLSIKRNNDFCSYKRFFSKRLIKINSIESIALNIKKLENSKFMPRLEITLTTSEIIFLGALSEKFFSSKQEATEEGNKIIKAITDFINKP